MRRKISSPAIVIYPKATMAQAGLSTIIEDLNDLYLSSGKKKARDDSDLL
jgi:hypothetical protein